MPRDEPTTRIESMHYLSVQQHYFTLGKITEAREVESRREVGYMQPHPPFCCFYDWVCCSRGDAGVIVLARVRIAQQDFWNDDDDADATADKEAVREHGQ
ncbi:hypothetical protein Slin15195_G129480 [Septoria linicola]|uniref:Uncharacterized protein n=1 Tax=Septoria linicola TaxID=215465 RepID=A0A9Q9B2A2_9PEZI|nr:hypothetical protein Slin15195_G129480 [Septoria linicola]